MSDAWVWGMMPKYEEWCMGVRNDAWAWGMMHEGEWWCQGVYNDDACV